MKSSQIIGNWLHSYFTITSLAAVAIGTAFGYSPPWTVTHSRSRRYLEQLWVSLIDLLRILVYTGSHKFPTVILSLRSSVTLSLRSDVIYPVSVNFIGDIHSKYISTYFTWYITGAQWNVGWQKEKTSHRQAKITKVRNIWWSLSVSPCMLIWASTNTRKRWLHVQI